MTEPQSQTRFAICVANENCDDLQIWRLYPILPDRHAAKDDYLRVIDDSGEDYLYPARRFVVVEFPEAMPKN